ncbi:hypothetical protein LINPERHAP1_LOCUS15624 [Linum perenne]
MLRPPPSNARSFRTARILLTFSKALKEDGHGTVSELLVASPEFFGIVRILPFSSSAGDLTFKRIGLPNILGWEHYHLIGWIMFPCLQFLYVFLRFNE